MDVPLKGLCILHRGNETQIRPNTAEEAMAELFHQGCAPTDAADAPRFQALIRQLAESVYLWRMNCIKDPSAAATACEAMHKRI